MVYFSPLIDVGLIAVALFAFNTLVRRRFMNQEAMDELKAKQKEWKACLKEKDKQSMKRAEELQKDVMDLNLRVMKGSMPAMLITLGIFLAIWPFMGTNYAGYEFPPQPYLTIPWGEGWFWYYFIVVIVLSIALKIGKTVLKKRKKEKGVCESGEAERA